VQSFELPAGLKLLKMNMQPKIWCHERTNC